MSGRPATSQYVIARHENGRPELLRVSLEAGDENALPVFSFEESARKYLRHSNFGPNWYVKESSNGELISLLLGLLSDVGWVLPNPLPQPLAAEDALLNIVDRGSFVGFLLAP